ncbi:MAG: PAS domain S-box protein [Salinivirgaceae bacterium]|nr:PAS domain S-box protein [Salinivirgaceae bacterium]
MNKTIVRIQDSEQFIKDICRIAIENGGFLSAWVKFDCNGLELNGIEEFAGLKNNLHELKSPKNPINIVYDNGKYLVSNNISLDNNLSKEWKNRSLDFGCKSFIILPINIFDSTCGCCCFYSNEIGFFDEVEINLLDELANDISFALEYLQNKQIQIHTEKELLESEERFRVLYNSSPDMYVSVSPKDAIVKLCNDTLLKKTAYLKNDVIGVTVFKLYHEDSVEQAKKVFNQFVKTGKVADVELFLKRKDGSKLPVSLNVAAVRDESGEILYSISSWRDITEKIENIRQLQMNAAKWQSTFNAITDSVSIIDMEGRIVQSNGATKTLLNISTGDMKEKCCFELIHGMNAPHPNCPFERLKQSKKTESMIFTEENRWFEVNVDPLFDSNNVLMGAVHVVSDITERKKNEIELINAKENAEESDRLKSAFLTNMSHEIRTPMNAVLGFSQLLIKANTTDEEKKQFAEFVKINGESLMKIIDDIIDISKIQSKLITIKKTDFDLHMVLNELEKYYSQFLEQKRKTNLKLLLEIPENKSQEFYINTDEIRLKQILNNLISNAIKYSEKGNITFGYTQTNNRLNFYVNDTGYGISKNDISKIFERFIQVSKKYVSKQEGTGLGLPISKELVALLGGELKVISKEGVGSTFSFSIPLVAANPVARAKAENKNKRLHDLSKYKILIADDEDSNYVLTKRLLKETKVTTDWAMNGKMAVEMAENNNYDLIIMDIKMPDMDGIEATRLIKKHNKNQPIIIQTAFAMTEVKNQAIKAGCDDFIVKPISLEYFLELVKKHLNI